MKNAMFKFSAALTLAAAATSAAYAGGFMLTEQSVAGLGRAYAGSGIVGDDLSAVWYNPAGMVLLPGTQFQMGSVMAYLDLDVETNKGDTDNGAKHGVPIPNMFFTHQMNEVCSACCDTDRDMGSNSGSAFVRLGSLDKLGKL